MPTFCVEVEKEVIYIAQIRVEAASADEAKDMVLEDIDQYDYLFDKIDENIMHSEAQPE